MKIKKITIIVSMCLSMATHIYAQAGYMGKKHLVAIDYSGFMDINKHFTVEYWQATTRNTGLVFTAGLNYCEPPRNLYSDREYILNRNDSSYIIYSGKSSPSSFKMVRVGVEYVVQSKLVGMAVPIGYFYKYGIEIGYGNFNEKGSLEGEPVILWGSAPSYEATKKYNEIFNLFQFNIKGTFGRNFLLTKTLGLGLGVNWNMIFSFTNKDSYGGNSEFSFGGAPFSAIGNTSFRKSLYDPYYKSFSGNDTRVLLTPYLSVFYLYK